MTDNFEYDQFEEVFLRFFRNIRHNIDYDYNVYNRDTFLRSILHLFSFKTPIFINYCFL